MSITPSSEPENAALPPVEPAREQARPYAAMEERNYRRFALGFLCSSVGLQMMGTALGWELYERTKDELVLGFVGLCRALPVVLMALPAGPIIDHAERRVVLVATQIALAVTTAALALVSRHEAPVWVYYVVISLTACARSFNGPARASLLPDIVSPINFQNAVTWNSGAFQIAAAVGPLLAGVMIDFMKSAWAVYTVTSALCAIFAITAIGLRPRERERKAKSALTLADMSAGMGHVWRDKSILSTLTLDLFAVLLGGATALMPVYAKDILHVDAVGLGWLRAAPFIGAFLMALLLLHLPPMRRAGMLLLLCVGGFGVCTIVFGFSENFALSMGVLIILGGLDNVSVVIRHVLVQVRTPTDLRGRVSAVNSVFIESSNELGAFESGLVARLFNPVISVVSGGIGTLCVVLGVAALFPSLRKLDRLEESRDAPPAKASTA